MTLKELIDIQQAIKSRFKLVGKNTPSIDETQEIVRKTNRHYRIYGSISEQDFESIVLNSVSDRTQYMQHSIDMSTSDSLINQIIAAAQNSTSNNDKN